MYNYQLLRISILTILTGLVCINEDLTAQRFSLYSNYQNNHLYNINPAAAGFDGSFISQLTFSKKWIGVAGSPSCQVFSTSVRLGEEDFYDDKMFINRPLFNIADRVGLGFSIYNESNGPLQNTGVLFAYAYHIPFQENRLSFGLSGSVTQHYLNTQMFKPVITDDPELYSDNKVVVPDVNFGILFHNPEFFAGFSVNNIVNLKKSMDHTNTSPDIIANAGYNFKINSAYKIEPALYLWKFSGDKLIADLNCKIIYRNRNWILLSYQGYKTLLAGLGFRIKKGIQFGYSYAISTQGLSAYYLGNQSLSLYADVAALINQH